MPDISPVGSSRNYTPEEEEQSAEAGTRIGEAVKEHFEETARDLRACVQPREVGHESFLDAVPTKMSAKLLTNPALRSSPPAPLPAPPASGLVSVPAKASEDPVQMSPEGNGPTCAPPKPAPEPDGETACHEVDRHPKLSPRETKDQGEIVQGHPVQPNEVPGYALQQQLAIQNSVRSDPIAAVVGGATILRGGSREEVYKNTQASDAVWALATSPAGGHTGAASQNVRLVTPPPKH